MKQRLPGLLCLLAALLVCIAAARRDGSDTARFVRQNQAELTALAEEVLAAGFGGDEVFYPGVICINYAVYMESGTFWRPFVEFHTDHLSGYSGFYYSPTDIPVTYQGADVTLQKTNTGWAWEHPGGYGTTEKITDCWYTFEAYF